MRLTSISVTNFRSITKAHKIALGRKTVLLGRNNEGKSNILRALELAMRLLQSHALPKRETRFSRYFEDQGLYAKGYKWERDFPLALQGRKNSGTQTIIKLTFYLDDKEVEEFKKKIGSSLNGDLPIKITIGKANTAKINVVKQGTGSKQLNDKSNDIAAFVAKKIVFNYIPAVRTEQKAADFVQYMVAEKLKGLEQEEDYKKAIDTIEKLQKPLLEELGKALQSQLEEFLPNIKKVKVEISDEARRYALRRNVEILVDDGNFTSLSLKGDGVKSLSALSLLRNRAPGIGASIVAVEEPEAHLHPGAIHQLYKVIENISEENQVILTTHNPLFVDRDTLSSNVIVEDGKASTAKSISKIRDTLGVEASDNLANAKYVLVVEGGEDKIALEALLRHISSTLRQKIDSHQLVIEDLNGASNLTYRLSHLKTTLCKYHCFLDYDEEGKRAFEKAQEKELLNESNVTFSIANGGKEAEFEDCLDKNNYSKRVFDVFGVNLSTSKFRGKGKWSERVKNCLLDSGKPSDKKTIARIKYEVARSVSDSPSSALHYSRRSSIDALAASLELFVAE